MRSVIQSTFLSTAMLVAMAAPAVAQNFPAKPVRLIIPFPAAGPSDVLGRLLAEKVAERWGQQVVIENRGGAAGNIGAEFVAKSAADGYTLLLNASSHVINASMYASLPYDPIKDFTPITQVASYMHVFVVHPSLPVASVQQFVALAKARPGELPFANAGTGTPGHLAAELFKIYAGIKYVNVPYKGSAPATTDLLGGQVIAMFNNPVNTLPYTQAGRLRGLAVTGSKRLAVAPELPTIAESGYPGFEAGTWYGLYGPAQLPPNIVAKIHDEFVRALRLADVQQKLGVQGWDSIGNSPAEFAAISKSELDKWAKVVKAAGLRPE